MKIKWRKQWIILGSVCFFIVLTFFLTPSFSFLIDEKEITDFIWKENMRVEVYSKVRVSDFVTVQDGSLEDEIIDTSKLGDQEVFFTYLNNNGKKKKKSFHLLVVDTTSPLIWISDSYTVVRGNSKKIEDSVLCGDNYDKKPVCKVEGSYNFDEVGNYSLTYYAVDQSGNETRKPFVLKVVDKISSSSKPSGISLKEINERYASIDASIGIDVSKWQQVIDWEEVKESGIEFVMIRLGTQIGPGKESKLDDYFIRNIVEAKRVGLKVGVYYYSYASSTAEAQRQAMWVSRQLFPYKLDLPVVFDWECYHLFNSFDISLYDLNQIADSFLKVIERNGYRPMMYGSKNYLQEIWNLLEYDVWLAHYTKKTDYSGDYKMWQFTNVGIVPGIDSFVDIDLLF